MWRTPAFVRPQDDGDFRAASADLGGFNDHLQGEFSAGDWDLEVIIELAGESAHAAIAIADACVKQSVEKPGKAGIAEVFVKRRHGSGLDPAPKAVAHNHLKAFPQFLDEMGNLGEVITIVRVSHDDELAPGRFDPCLQGSTVSSFSHLDDARPVAFSNFY